MFKRFILTVWMLLTWQVAMTGITELSASMILAQNIVADMVADKTPAEVLEIVDQIAVELSNHELCGIEAVQSMTERGIPFEMALDSITKACNLTGPQVSALVRDLAPGFNVSGGLGPGASL
jgi:hypothetical protein